jgi:hypothetical protein
VRLQLSPSRPLRALAAAGVLAGLLAGGAPRARAGQDAASRVTVFQEPSNANMGITVVHPQLDVGTTLGPDFRLATGYSVDIVSGATPRIFGPRTGGVDVVTSASKFDDIRHQVGGTLGYERPTSSLALSGSYGWEKDYRSATVTGATRTDLLDHNFTLGLSYTHNFDSVCDNNNVAAIGRPLDLKPLETSTACFTGAAEVVTHKLHIDTFQPSLSWTVTPRTVLEIGSTIQLLDGFQSNPYRQVLLGRDHRTPQERLPQFRQRYAVYARAGYALPAVRASMMATGRLYQDSWAVQAATGEVLLNKYFGQSFLITLRGRYHLQSGASFYRDAIGYLNLGPGGQFWTGDRELSPMSNYLAGGKVALLRRPEQERSSWFVEMELNLKYELLLYRLESPDAPNADRTKAHIVQAAFSLRF